MSVRVRRFRRKTLTKNQLDLAESSDRAELYAGVLASGIADALRHVSTLEDLKNIKLLIDEDLTAALQTVDFTYKNYVSSMNKGKGKKTK
jgi:hypothetical protein